jgi:hypothetical protein
MFWLSINVDGNVSTWFASLMQHAFFNSPELFAIFVVLLLALFMLMARIPAQFSVFMGVAIFYMLYVFFQGAPIFQALFALSLLAVGVMAGVAVIRYAKR